VTENFDAYAAYYDIFNSEKDYAQETKVVMDYLQRRGMTSGSIFELGCGSGGHAFELVSKGFDVTGVDLSDHMLDIARKRASSISGPVPSFVSGDARSVRLGKTFDILLSLFHVASYQTSDEDIQGFFDTAAKHLKPGGVLLFDCWFGPAVLWQKPERRVRKFTADGVNAERTAEPEHVPSENRVCVKFTINVTGPDLPAPVEIVEEHNMRYFFQPELKKFLSDSFEDIEVFAWETRSPPDRDDWTAVVVARRK